MIARMRIRSFEISGLLQLFLCFEVPTNGENQQRCQDIREKPSVSHYHSLMVWLEPPQVLVPVEEAPHRAEGRNSACGKSLFRCPSERYWIARSDSYRAPRFSPAGL